MGVVKGNIGDFTPICNNCGVCLCWDISRYEYEQNMPFWDNWKCEDCDPNAKGSRKRYLAERKA
jgi:hypothetical protein